MLAYSTTGPKNAGQDPKTLNRPPQRIPDKGVWGGAHDVACPDKGHPRGEGGRGRGGKDMTSKALPQRAGTGFGAAAAPDPKIWQPRHVTPHVQRLTADYAAAVTDPLFVSRRLSEAIRANLLCNLAKDNL